MEDILQKEFLNNTVESYLWVAGTILLLLLIKRLISKYLAGQLLGVITNRKKAVKKAAFLNLVISPIEKFLIAFITITALDKLKFPDAFRFRIYHVTSEDVIHALAIVIMVIVFVRLCIRILEFFAQILEEKANHSKDLSHNQLIVFFKDFFKVILVLIGILLVLRFAFNKNITSLFTGLSIVGAAVALSMRESLENLIASFIIFFDKPFIMGDQVKVQNFSGTVEKIGLRSTRIRTESKTYISVPNKQMVDSIVDNITLRTQRKVELRLELSLSATAQQLEQLTPGIRNILEQKSSVENSQVYLLDTGKNAHIVAVDYFTVMPQSIEEFNALREEVNIEVIKFMEQMRIELAASNMDIVLKKEMNIS